MKVLAWAPGRHPQLSCWQPTGLACVLEEPLWRRRSEAEEREAGFWAQACVGVVHGASWIQGLLCQESTVFLCRSPMSPHHPRPVSLREGKNSQLHACWISLLLHLLMKGPHPCHLLAFLSSNMRIPEAGCPGGGHAASAARLCPGTGPGALLALPYLHPPSTPSVIHPRQDSLNHSTSDSRRRRLHGFSRGDTGHWVSSGLGFWSMKMRLLGPPEPCVVGEVWDPRWPSLSGSWAPPDASERETSASPHGSSVPATLDIRGVASPARCMPIAPERARMWGLESLPLIAKEAGGGWGPSACACYGWTGNGSSLSSSLPLLSVSSLLPAPLSHAKHIRTNSKKLVCLWGECPEF